MNALNSNIIPQIQEGIKDIDENILNDIDAVFIEEGQFFQDINIIDNVLNMNKNVYVSFLNADYKMEPFHVTNSLYAKADKVIHLTAVCCTCGAKAPFTKRLINNNEQVLVGSQESYEPRCRKCFNSLEHTNLL
jgi:thymidine kinase